MEDNHKLFYRFMRPIIYFIFRLLYRPVVYNSDHIPKEGPIILIGNHRHALDPLLLGISTSRTVSFLAKKELHEGFSRGFMRAMGTVPIDLDNKNDESRKLLEEILNKGEAVGMFPESKRNYTDEPLLPFKYGAAALASKTGALIVPSAISGEYRLFRKGLSVTFGAPTDITGMELEEANWIIREEVLNLMKVEK